MCNFNRLACVSTLVLVLAGCGGADERKASYMDRGAQLVEEGNFEKAQLEFKNALQIDPKDADAHYQLGLILEKLGEWRPAMSQFLAVIKLDKTHVDAHIHAGQIYLLGNALDMALEEAETAVAGAPANADALVLRAGVKAKSGDIPGGFSDGLAALKVEPGHVNGIALVSSLHLSQQDHAKALMLVNDGLVKHPTNTNLMTMKAKVLMSQKDIAGTGQILEDIIKTEPDNMLHRFRLGSFYISQQKLDKAEKVLRDAAAVEKEDNKANLMLIEFLARYRGFEAAEKELLLAIENNPDDSALKFGLSALYKTTDVDKSIKVLEGIVDQSKYDDVHRLKAKSQIAVLQMGLKNIDEAEMLAEEVLKENPKDVDALTVRGGIALAKKEADAAIVDFRSVLNSSPGSVKHLRLLAHAHSMNGEYELARVALEKAADASPKDAIIRSELAEVLLRTGKPELAIEQIREVLAIAPDNASALETLFKLQSAKQDWKAALGTAERIKEAFPESGEGHHLSGLVHQMNKDFTSSIDEYTKALEKSPNAIQPLAQLVRGYMSEDKADEALARVNNVLKTNPENHIAQNMKGEVLLAQKKVPEAREVFLLAIKTKPDFRTPYVRLASTYAMEKNTDEMIKIYESGLKALPDDPVFITGLAGIYEQTGKVDQAISFYEQIIAREPENILVANNLAMLYVDNTDSAESLSKAQELTRILMNSKNPAFLDTIGWVSYKAGDYTRAISLLEDAVAKAPEEPALQYHLGMAYFKQGKLMKIAKDHLELAVNNSREFKGKDQAQATLKSIQ